MFASRPVIARALLACVVPFLLIACGDANPNRPESGNQPPAISIAVAPGSISLDVGTTQQLAVAVSGTTNSAVNWSTSASSIATVSSSGLVTGVAPGAAVITAAAVADPARVATATITVSAPPTPLVLRVPVDTVRPGMALRAIVTGIALPTSLPATLGTAAILMARDSDSSLVGFVPEMPIGTAALRVTIGNRSGQVSVDVRPGLVIADPTLEITRLADRVRQRYSTMTVPAGYTTAEWTRSRAVVDSLDRELRAALTAAPAAERLAAARMLAAYPASTSALASLFVTPDRCGGAADRILAKGVNVIGNLFDLRAAEVLTTKLRNLVGMTNHLDGVLDYITAMATFPVDCAVTEILENDAPASTTVDHGGTLGIVVTAVIRSVDGSRSQDPTIQRVTDSIDRLIATFRTLPQAIQSVFGKLPTRVQELPAQPPARTPLDPQYMRVASVTPASVSVTIRADGNRVALVATTTATEPTAFTAVLRHVDDATVTTTVRATVRPVSNVTVTVSPSALTIAGAGTERVVSATVTGATNTGLSWISSNAGVVSVVGTPVGLNATLRAQNPGTATVRVTSAQDPTKSATITVTVTSGIGITVNPPAGTLTVGQTLPLTATLTGTNSTGVIWRSGAESVATVDATGLVTARAVGTAVITATAAYDFEVVARATITVTAPVSAVAISISPTSASVVVGGTQSLSVNLTGVSAGQSTSFSWTSSNSSVVAVAAGNGGLTITGLAPGTSTITVRPVADPTKVATATITVTNGSTGTPGATRLTSGVAVSGLAGAEGSAKLYVITVPTGATGLSVRTSGGIGDADLYVRRGSPPTSSAVDCASVELTTVESCTFTNPAAGEWYVLLVGYAAYSGVTLTATVTGGGGSLPPSGSGCQAQWGPTLKGVWRATSYIIVASEYIPQSFSSVTYEFGETSFKWTFNYPSGSPRVVNTTYTLQTDAAANLVGANRCSIVMPTSDGSRFAFKIQGYNGGVLDLRDDGNPSVPVFAKIVKQ